MKEVKQQWFFYFLSLFALSSILISLLVNQFNDEPVNIDGIYHIEVAKLFFYQGFNEVRHYNPVPLFPILLALFQKGFSTDFITVGFWFNAIGITTALSFGLMILKTLEVSPKVIIWSGILLLIYPLLNQLRTYILPDPEYLTFLFAGCWCLFKNLRTPRFAYTLGFSLCFLIATSFEFESIFIWCLAPFIFFFMDHFSRRKVFRHFFQHEALFLMILFILLIWILSHPHQNILKMKEIYEFQNYVDHISKGAELALSDSLRNNFLVIFIKTMTPLYLVFIIYGWLKNPPSPSPEKTLFVWLLFLFVSTPIIFYLESGVVNDRNLLPFCLMLSLLTGLSFPTMSPRLYLPAFFLLSFLLCEGFTPFNYSNNYLIQAGSWLNQHSAPSSKIYSNSIQVLFYANRPTLDWQINSSPDKIMNSLQNRGLQDYNYLAISLGPNDDKTLQQLAYRLSKMPIKIFRNKHDDKVVIFYVSH